MIYDLNEFESNNILSYIKMETENQEENKKVFRTIFGAEVLMPLNCPDEILEAVIREIKKQ